MNNSFADEGEVRQITDLFITYSLIDRNFAPSHFRESQKMRQWERISTEPERNKLILFFSKKVLKFLHANFVYEI